MTKVKTALDYRIERLGDKNLADVEKLHAAVYGKTVAPGFFARKYDTGFAGAKHVGYLAYDQQGFPIAFYAVIPCFMRFDDGIVLSAQSADTMTHPQYRNKGLFVELAQMTFQLCRSMGIALVFGFPNQNSLPGFLNKLGWVMTERMDCFIIRGARFPWAGAFGKFSILKKWYSKYRQRVLKKYMVDQQGLANSVFSDGYAGVYRDHHYRKYKTYTDTLVIKVSSAVLWIKIDGVLLIGDISVKPAEFEQMMRRLKKLAVRLGIKEIHFHASPGTTLHNLFIKANRPIPSFPVIFKDLARNSAIDKIKFTSADIDTF